MKKLVNDPRHVVREMLEGLVDLNPGQALLADEDVVVRANLPELSERPVAVLSGGGAGHEPAHAGYVGDGMLAAAISGDVFTSPSVDAVLTAIRAAGGPKGALLVVKNYTGDRLNFGLAAELATAGGIPTKVAVVADDAALRDIVEPARRRGIAGTVFVHKIAGAAAAAGLGLEAVAAEAEAAAQALGTMGVALGACTVPAAGKAGFSLGDDEMELGLGIHGEQGVRRVTIEPADRIVDGILDVLIADKALGAGDRVALLVNGLGGTPPMELAIVARRALQNLRAHKIHVERAWSGNFMTALEMPGVSLSVLKVDDARLARLDAPTNAPAWPGGGAIAERKIIAAGAAPAEPPPIAAGPLAPALKTIAYAVASAFEKQEAALTELDSRAGDGDLGISMVRGAGAIRALRQASWANPSTALAAMGAALGRAIAGSSGPFYAVALLRAARELDRPAIDGAVWAQAFSAAAVSISQLGGAKAGDRTMLDALLPATEAFAQGVQSGLSLREAWAKAIAAAEQGAEATAKMRPRLGRAAYLGDRALGAPDAGAGAVLVWMRAVGEAV
jgi:ATP-dependent dihydroxyacetone kinase